MTPTALRTTLRHAIEAIGLDDLIAFEPPEIVDLTSALVIESPDIDDLDVGDLDDLEGDGW